MSDRHVPGLLHPEKSALLVVDLQGRFARAIPDFDAVVAEASRLCRIFRVLALPVFATEQYPEGLGATIPIVRREIERRDLPGKTVFSSYAVPAVRAAMDELDLRSVLVTGIESHVCVLQSVHEMLAAGLEVHVAIDAVSSVDSRERDLALGRMQRAGAVLTSVEAATYELLRDARHAKFREVREILGVVSR